LFCDGHSVTDISRTLHRSRNWVYKWINRGKSEEENWFLNETTEPRNKPNKIAQEIESEIINSRVRLIKRETAETKYSFCGAIAIHHDLDRKGVDEKPSLTTINRVIKRNGLVITENQKAKNDRPEKYYPWAIARYPGFLQQLDIITPLYITGYGKVVSINRIDVYNGHANLDQYDAKNTESVLGFLIKDWQAFGIPRYIQVDNEAAFKGGLYHPKTFGRLVRFCLNFGVQLIFIPFKEPWRNGHIESFNNRFEQLVWYRYRFKNLEHLRAESIKFKKQHNEYQTYKKNEFGKHSGYSFTNIFLPEDFYFDSSIPLPITTGFIHFIRFVDNNGYTSIFNETIYIENKLSFEYVWCVLNTREQKILIYYKATKKAQKELVKIEQYKLRESVKNRIPMNRFRK